MTVTISTNNANRVYRFRNYFTNKDVNCMICNDESAVSLFDLSANEAEFLLNAFTKHFHLRPAAQLAHAS